MSKLKKINLENSIYCFLSLLKSEKTKIQSFYDQNPLLKLLFPLLIAPNIIWNTT